MRELESERGGGVTDEQGVGAHNGRRDRCDVVRVEGLGGGAPGAVDRRVVPLWCAHSLSEAAQQRGDPAREGAGRLGHEEGSNMGV